MSGRTIPRSWRAFTLLEVMIATLIVAILQVSLDIYVELDAIMIYTLSILFISKYIEEYIKCLNAAFLWKKYERKLKKAI